MERLKLSTLVYAPPQDVYDVLIDFEDYPKYTQYVNNVKRRGDGGEGTEFGISFGWWKLSYTAWSEVTGLDEPNLIEWELTKDIDADGRWEIEDVTDEAEADVEAVTRVTIDVQFQVSKSGSKILDLPRFVRFGWVVDRVKPLIFKEARSVLQNLIYELEGEKRTPVLEIHETPSHVTEAELREISA